MFFHMIATIIQDGLMFDSGNWGQGIPDSGNIQDAIAQLFSLLEDRQVDYLLVGGIALLTYVEGRNTRDIDFLMSLDELTQLPEIVIFEQNKDFARGDFLGLQVDLLLTENPLFDLARSRYTSQAKVGDKTIRIISVDGLMLLKLYALPSLYRQERFDRATLYEGDITLLMLQYAIDTESLLDAMKPHVIASDLAEVREILGDIQRRINRRSRQ